MFEQKEVIKANRKKHTDQKSCAKEGGGGRQVPGAVESSAAAAAPAAPGGGYTIQAKVNCMLCVNRRRQGLNIQGVVLACWLAIYLKWL